MDKQKGRDQVSPNDPVNTVGPNMAPRATQKCWEAPGNKALFIICSLEILLSYSSVLFKNHTLFYVSQSSNRVLFYYMFHSLIIGSLSPKPHYSLTKYSSEVPWTEEPGGL